MRAGYRIPRLYTGVVIEPLIRRATGYDWWPTFSGAIYVRTYRETGGKLRRVVTRDISPEYHCYDHIEQQPWHQPFLRIMGSDGYFRLQRIYTNHDQYAPLKRLPQIPRNRFNVLPWQ